MYIINENTKKIEPLKRHGEYEKNFPQKRQAAKEEFHTEAQSSRCFPAIKKGKLNSII
jgi:hypothetical protein